ncbi:MAG: T9SS type A sorting domain-containing protein [Ignavibacteria bacterium]|nr:T9SS type A sorting domain-containing protein [Ignavibacteria bacterium]
MTKTRLLLFLFITFFSFTTDTRNCFSQSQFQIVINDSSNSGIEARSIIQTTDGGFVAAGETGTNGKMYIVKLNSANQLQWSRTIGDIGIALSVVQTTDGGFVVSGYGSLFGAGLGGPFIVKLTSAGIIEWSRVLLDGNGNAAYSIVQTIDGGYATIISPSFGGSSNGIIVAKLNSMGLIQWSKSFGGVCYGRCIKQTTDEGYVLAGAIVSPGLDLYVVKLDPNGSLQWAKQIGGANYEFAYSIVQTADGGYAAAGFTDSFGSEKMYIVKLESNGTLQWTRVVALNSDRAYSIVQTADGGYAVGGWTGGGMSGMLILKLNSDGSLQWSRVVKGNSTQTYAYSLIQTSDGGFAAAGYGGMVSATGMYIVKLDNNGNTCGNTVSHTIIESSGGILGSIIPTINNITLTDTLVTPQTGTHGFVTPLCVIGIQPITSEIPVSFKLYQNYPNPFNPVTKIKFDIGGTLVAQTFLSVYDMLGREVDILVNTDLQPGTYEVDWDGSNYASGVYYYSLSISGSSGKYQETKRMLLVK